MYNNPITKGHLKFNPPMHAHAHTPPPATCHPWYLCSPCPLLLTRPVLVPPSFLPAPPSLPPAHLLPYLSGLSPYCILHPPPTPSTPTLLAREACLYTLPSLGAQYTRQHSTEQMPDALLHNNVSAILGKTNDPSSPVQSNSSRSECFRGRAYKQDIAQVMYLLFSTLLGIYHN